MSVIQRKVARILGRCGPGVLALIGPPDTSHSRRGFDADGPTCAATELLR